MDYLQGQNRSRKHAKIITSNGYTNQTIKNHKNMSRMQHKKNVTTHQHTLGTVKKQMQQAVDEYLQSINPVQSVSVKRFEIETEAIDPLIWLHQHPHTVKTYWASRDHSIEIAGLDAGITMNADTPEQFASLYEKLSQLSATDERLKFFGGMRFDPLKPASSEWQAFPNFQFRLPRLEFLRRENRYFLVCNAVLHPDDHLPSIRKDAHESIEHTHSDIVYQPENIPECCTERIDEPQYAEWKTILPRVIDQISRHEALKKVVLARKSTFIFSGNIEPTVILKYMKESNPHSFLFLFRNEDGTTFLGSTPERLFNRNQSKIETEAVAGTRPRGSTATEDEQLKQDLLQNTKERREHQFVVDSIARALRSVCTLSERDKDVSVIENARVQHLYLPFHGVLKKGVKDADIIQALHPTPAVGGLPTDLALQKIRDIEPFDRGWYAAPLGWFGHNHAEFAVAIRSALMWNHHLHLFAGGGIVDGSDVEAEWQEIENKISNFLKLLNV
ncbi:MAG: isochorismate synthase [Caldithrix sp.]|nr:isochorismate synthase [Caldithrix sp.]